MYHIIIIQTPEMTRCHYYSKTGETLSVNLSTTSAVLVHISSSPDGAGVALTAADRTFSADGASPEADCGGPSLLLPEVE